MSDSASATDIVTVQSDHGPILLLRFIATDLGYQHGDRVRGEEEFWRVIRTSSAQMLSLCHHEIQSRKAVN